MFLAFWAKRCSNSTKSAPSLILFLFKLMASYLKGKFDIFETSLSPSSNSIAWLFFKLSRDRVKFKLRSSIVLIKLTTYGILNSFSSVICRFNFYICRATLLFFVNNSVKIFKSQARMFRVNSFNFFR